MYLSRHRATRDQNDMQPTEQPNNCIITIFGASGDLTRRKLLPELFNLFRRERMPASFAVFGVSRTPHSDDAFRAEIRSALDDSEDPVSAELAESFCSHLYYQPGDVTDPASFAALAERLQVIDREQGTGGNYLFYLSTAPALFADITDSLAAHGLHDGGDAWRRIIYEKPFGYDLATARELNDRIANVFHEDQVYRIDHYLGKETVQNMLVFRFGNGIFEPLWNRNFIDHVEITAAEHYGMEGRGKTYDRSGALRDMFQNHLMQVLGMVAMEPPARFNADALRNETIKVFQALRAIDPDEIEDRVVRGQYTAATIDGDPVPAYRGEHGIAPDSGTETYVAVKAFIDNWRWGGVPFYVRTGKRLPTRVTEVVVHFKQTPHRLFGESISGGGRNNQLIIRIQPDEGILIKFNMKQPGGGFEMRTVNMDFHYGDLANQYVPKAYERLLLDCMLGDATLFARRDALEACWAFVDPILTAWQTPAATKLHGYPAGTWGPIAATDLIEGSAGDWRYPCKNLTDDGEYCEL